MSDRVYIIAEAGVNHNGDPARALALVDAAATAGADAVKFQTFRPEALVTAGARQADYQIRNEGDAGSQLAMLQRLVLREADHHTLMARCAERDIDFLSSPFDPASAEFLIKELKLPRIKLGSGELTNGPLLLQLARSGRDLILSTGMATLDEIREALGVLAFGYLQPGDPSGRAALLAALAHPDVAEVLRRRVTLLHCTTEYPCPLDQVNLRAMDTLAEAFGLPVGYSDHTLGITVSVAAAARGACILEKHFTLDRTLPGPDHAASLEPDELAELVSAVRAVSQALGSADKSPAAAELDNARVARKSLVAARAIAAGEPFSADNLTVKRPGDGRSPLDYWGLLGQPAPRAYAADEVIE
jgi:N-acetylneuraminate synthase